MQTRLSSRIQRALAMCAALMVTVAAPSVSNAPSVERSSDRAEPSMTSSAAPEAPSWLSQAQVSICEREYEATDAGAGLQAPNRALGLRTYFEPAGARVVDREDDTTELVRLRTVAVGRGKDVRPVGSGEAVADGVRVELRRTGIAEWYENSEKGLEQGWTLAARPDGDGALAIEVA